MWTLSLEATTGPDPSVAIDFTGALDITIGSTTIPATVSAGVTATPATITAEVGAGVGRVDDVLGLSWLDLQSLSLEAAITSPRTRPAGTTGSTGTFAGSLSATLDLEDLTGQQATASVAFGVEAGSRGLAGSLDVTTNGLTVGVGQLATGLGNSADVSGVGVSLSDIAISVRFDLSSTTPAPMDTTTTTLPGAPTTTVPAGGSPAGSSTSKVTAAITGTASLDVNGASLSGTALLRGTSTGQPAAIPDLVFALRPNDPPMLSDFLDAGTSLPVDFEVPSVTVSVATRDVIVAVDDLDPATAQFTRGDPLDLPRGAGLTAGVKLPSNLKDVLGEIGVDVNSPLVIQGQIPMFGRTETSLRIELPEFAGDGVFRAGSVAFEISGTTAGQFSTKLIGSVTVAIPRTNDPACDPETTAYDARPECLDVLTFELESGFSVSPTTGLTVSLAAGLTGENGDGSDGWVDPLGIRGITIFELRIEGSVSAGAGANATPSFTIGFLGRISIAGIPDLTADQGGRTPIDLTVSFALSASPRFPFIEPVGFTFASGRGFGFNDMITLAEVISQTDLPDDGLLPTDLRLENVFVSVASRTIESLCLRQGIYISAELHLGGTPVAGDPQCLPPAPPLNDPTAPPPATQRCIGSASCLAAVLIDVNPSPDNGGPRLAAQGVMNSIDLGALHLDPTVLSLELSPSTQRLFVQGGVTLDDPIDPAGPAWAEGSVAIDFTPTQLIARGSASILVDSVNPENTGLGIRFDGVAALNLTNPQFQVVVQFDQNLLAAIGAEIGPDVEPILAEIGGFLAIDVRRVNWFRNLAAVLEANGETPQWLIDVLAAAGTAEQAANDVNNAFTQIGLPPPFTVLEIRNLVLVGVSIDFGGIPAIDLVDPMLGADGCVNLHGRSADGECYVVPPFTIDVPGVCAIDGLPEALGTDVFAVLCGLDSNADAFITEVYESDARSISALPNGLTGAQLLRREGPSIGGATLEVACGTQTIDYGAGTASDPVVTVQLGGQTVATDLGVDPFGITSAADVVPIDSAGLTEILDDFATDNGPLAEGCSNGLGDGAGELFFADPDEDGKFTATGLVVEEGTQFVALVECGKADRAVVDFGDGTVVNVDMDGGDDSGDDDPDSTELVRHTYGDDNGTGGPYRPTLDCEGFSQPAEVLVTNFAATVGVEVFNPVDPDNVFAGEEAVIEVTVLERGADTVTVDLFVGSEQQSLEFPPSAGGPVRVIEVPYVLVDSEQGELIVTVESDDGDGGTDADEVRLPVLNAPPAFVSLTPFEVADGSARIEGEDGELLVGAGQEIVWQLTVRDPNVGDEIRAVIDWGDGSAPQQVIVAPTGLIERSAWVTHTFVAGGTVTASIELTDGSDNVEATEQIEVTNIGPRFVYASLEGVDNDVDVVPAETGASLTLLLGILDPDGDVQAGAPITYVIDWGDGQSTAPLTLRSFSAEVPVTSIRTHSYSGGQGPVTVTITATDADGATTVVTRRVELIDGSPRDIQLEVVDPPIAEGQLTEVEVSFTTQSTQANAATVLVDWGPSTGATSSSDVGMAPGARSTTRVGRVFNEDGTYPITITVTDNLGRSTTVAETLEVVNQRPEIRFSGGEGDSNAAGAAIEFIWAFVDPGILDDVTMSIDWGDGNSTVFTESTLIETCSEIACTTTRSLNGRQGLIEHTYTAAGTYTISVTGTDDDGAVSDPVTYAVVVTEPGPTGVVATATPNSLDEGGSTTLDLGFVTTAAADPHSVSIDWGDGSSETVALADADRAASIEHTYSDDGDYAVTVSVTDADGRSGTASTAVTVVNVAPTVGLTAAAAMPVDIDAPIAFDLTTSDAGVLDVVEVVIDWGDGSTDTVVMPAGDPNDQATTIEHVYAEPGSYDVAATADDGDDGIGSSDPITVTVIDSPPTDLVVATTTADPLEGSETVLAINFVDASNDDTHGVIVDWGDGSSTEQTLDGGARSADIPHVYEDDGTYDVAVVVTDAAGRSVSTSTSVVVANAAPTIELFELSPAGADENAADLTATIRLSDPSALDTHQVVVDWGDGWSETVGGADVRAVDARYSELAVDGGGSATLTLQNRYGDDGSYTVTVRVTDDDGGEVIEERTVDVVNVAPVMTTELAGAVAVAAPSGDWLIGGVAGGIEATVAIEDAGSDDVTVTLSAGDGTTPDVVTLPGDTAPDGTRSPQVAPLSAEAVVGQRFEAPCVRALTLTAIDDDGGSVEETFAVIIVDDSGDPARRTPTWSRWRLDINRGRVDGAELACLLDGAGALSSVFLGASELDGDLSPVGVVDVTAIDTRGVPELFGPVPRGLSRLERLQYRFDRQLLTVWLNVMAGEISLDDTNRAGRTYLDVITEAETTRLSSTSASALRQATIDLQLLGSRSARSPIQ